MGDVFSMPDIMCALQDQDHWKPSQPGHSTCRFRHLLAENLVGSAVLCTGLILGPPILSPHFAILLLLPPTNRKKFFIYVMTLARRCTISAMWQSGSTGTAVPMHKRMLTNWVQQELNGTCFPGSRLRELHGCYRKSRIWEHNLCYFYKQLNTYHCSFGFLLITDDTGYIWLKEIHSAYCFFLSVFSGVNIPDTFFCISLMPLFY